MKKSVLFLSGLFSVVSLTAQNLPVSQTATNKNVVLEELTGTNCQFCPDGHKRAKEIADANPGRVVLINVHAGGFAPNNPNLKTTDGDALDVFFDATGYPSGALQRKPHASDLARIATGRGNWVGQANAALSQVSPVNIAMEATLDASTRVVTVTVELFYTSPFASGTNNYLNVGIIQDNWEGPQVGSALNPDAVLPNGNYLHQHIFRGFINAGGTWGDPIDASSTGVITRTYTYTLPATLNGIPMSIGDLEFFAQVNQGHNGVSNSEVYTGTVVLPTYTNVPNPTASMNSIVNPFNVCAGSPIFPLVKVTNSGDEITSIHFESIINGVATQDYVWNGSIPVFGSAEIQFPGQGFTAQGSNSVVINIIDVNGGTGTVGSTSTMSKPITIADVASSTNVTVKVTCDQYGSETTWKIFNSSGTQVAAGGPYTDAGASGQYPQPDVNLVLPNGCYRVVVYDSYGDGFDGTYGNGNFQILSSGATSAAISSFTTSNSEDAMQVNEVLGLNENGSEIGLSIYPNPATDKISVAFVADNMAYTITVSDIQGRVIATAASTNSNGNQLVEIPLNKIAKGNYVVKVTPTNGPSSVQNVVIQ